MGTVSFVAGGNPLLSPLSLFLVQLLLIVILARLIGNVLAYFNQPRVVAEVIGGILLGESALSKIPAFKNAIFPQESLQTISVVANIGLILFLFLVGVELDLNIMLKQARKSSSISLAGIIFPFGLSIATSKALYDLLMKEEEKKHSFVVFFLFIGVALSITAFPVLARILSENRMLSTNVGQITIAAAAVDDTVAWIFLLLVIALVNNSSQMIMALYVFLVTVAYSLILFFAIRPIFKKMIDLGEDSDQVSGIAVFLTFMLVFISAWFTEAVGVHAIFGAFIAGLIIPHDHGFAIKVTEKIEDIVTILFLPLFFAFSGLNTRLDKLDSGLIGGMLILVILTACVGKIFGVCLAGRLNKLSTRDSLAIGVLMNTKGLVELIILNVGLEAKVINETIFTIMVVMALVTTFMTVPLVSWIYPKSKIQKDTEHIKSALHLTLPSRSIDENFKPLKVLLTIQNSQSARPMMSVMQLASSLGYAAELIAMRLLELGERIGSLMRATESSQKTLRTDPVLSTFKTFAQLNHFNIDSILTVCPLKDFADQIVATAEENGVNLIVISHRPYAGISAGIPDSSSQSTADHLSYLLEAKYNKAFILDTVCLSASCSVAVIIDRGFNVEESSRIFDESKDTVTSFASVRSRTIAPELASLYVPFIGGSDEREAVLFALNFHKGVNVHFLVIHSESMAALPTQDLDESIGTSFDMAESLRSVSTIDLNQLASDDIEADEELLETLRQEVDESMISTSVNNTGLMTIEEIKVPYTSATKKLVEWIKNSQIGKTDL